MKHLVSKEHYPHLKKRAVLELVGLLALFLISYDQRALIETALTTIRQSDLLYLLLMVCTYWLMLPLTPLSYRLLLNKPLPIKTTMLAQLAGAGPGRIMPGNLGHMSMAAAHIAKSGSKLQTAIAVTVINNFIGIVTNSALLVGAVIVESSLIGRLSSTISPMNIVFLFAGVLAIMTITQWLSHAHGTRKAIASVHREFKKHTRNIIRHPDRLLTAIIIALFINFGHIALLVFSGKAVGISISPSDALIALSIGIFIGGVIPTPGGFGAVEAGIISALILLGYPSNEAVTAALLLRIVTYWMPLMPGLFAYLYLRERKLL